MNYAGLNVISVDNMLGANAPFSIAGLIVFIASVVFMERNTEWRMTAGKRVRQYAACIVCLAGLLTMIIGTLPIYHTGQVVITATISDDASFSDISRMYEIVGNQGNVYTLKDKNKLDAIHYVCEMCGKEIESGPPWLCSDCRRN